MVFWNRKKETPVVKQTTIPNLPIIEALGKITTNYIDVKTREGLANTFNTVSEIYAPIMYAGSSFSNMKLKLFVTDKDGQDIEEIYSHEILKKLSAPNPLNNWKDFLLNYYVNKKVFGNAYIFKYQPSGFESVEDAVFWVLPSQYVYPLPTSRKMSTYYKATDKDKFIRGYSFFNRIDLNKKPNWLPEEIMHQKEPNLDLNIANQEIWFQLLEGKSPLSTLTEPISNIKAAYEAQNVILKKRGALGILTPENSKDAIGSLTLTPEDKEELQKQFESYGLGKTDWQYIISNVQMRWQPMSIPIRELQLYEGVENNMIAICNTLNFPISLLNYLKGATYSNVNELKKSLYQDNIIPEANSFVSELGNFLGLPEKNLVLKADFSHIPVLQADAKLEAEKDQITVNTILKIQTAIKEGILNIENAQSILSNILSFSDEMIAGMISEPINNQNEDDEQQ